MLYNLFSFHTPTNSYSMEVEQIVCLLRIPMDQITKIVIGKLFITLIQLMILYDDII